MNSSRGARVGSPSGAVSKAERLSQKGERWGVIVVRDESGPECVIIHGDRWELDSGVVVSSKACVARRWLRWERVDVSTTGVGRKCETGDGGRKCETTDVGPKDETTGVGLKAETADVGLK